MQVESVIVLLEVVVAEFLEKGEIDNPDEWDNGFIHRAREVLEVISETAEMEGVELSWKYKEFEGKIKSWLKLKDDM